jgi:hypothetical protein
MRGTRKPRRRQGGKNGEIGGEELDEIASLDYGAHDAVGGDVRRIAVSVVLSLGFAEVINVDGRSPLAAC